MLVGVLGLQGCVSPHIRMLQSLGVEACSVRTIQELKRVSHLIMPGGESSTMLKLLQRDDLFNEIKSFGKRHPIWGICAGAILLAREVENPRQASMDLIGIKAHRNHYGSQLDSFETEISCARLPVSEPKRALKAQFIRAPLLQPLDVEIKILAEHNQNAVLMQADRILVSSFHVELGVDSRLHKYFLGI